MLTNDTARLRAMEYLLRQHPDGDVAIVDAETMEKAYGWVFFYNSKRFLKTNNVSHAFAGNGPLVVKKADGSIHQLGSAFDVEKTLQRFENSEETDLNA